MASVAQSNRTLDRIISSIGDLPASPVIVSTLMSLTADINANLNTICKTIMADQSLSARVLKLSNSSFYGRAKEVYTLREAIILLGFKTLRSLVVASSTHTLYQGVADKRFRDCLWEHTLAAAIASRLIAQAINHPGFEEAFIAGLMHDIGKLVLMQKIPDQYQAVIIAANETGRTHAELEREKLGFDHTEVGRLLLQKWAFPRLLVQAVAEHHYPSGDNQRPLPLAFVINAADTLVHLKDTPTDPVPDGPAEAPPFATVLGLDQNRIEEVGAQLTVQFAAEKELYRAAEGTGTTAGATGV
jgi:putative nucleotidyltransferase with HDIG domain